MARQGRSARRTKGNGRAWVVRLGPGEAREDQQVGGADLEQEGAGIVGQGADQGRRQGAGKPGPHRRDGPPARRRSDRARRRRGPRRDQQRQEDEDDRPGEAVGRELQAALGDLGQLVEAAGVEHRAGQVGVGAGERGRSAPAGRRPRSARAIASSSGAPAAPGDRRGGDRGAERAGRSRRRRRRRSGRRRRRRRERARRARKAATARRVERPRREPGQRRAGAGDDEHREQRLELVADPVEADAEPGVRAEQGERGERRAGDTSTA